MPYVSDEHVVINVQGLRTVRREDGEVKGFQPHRLMWSYKGQEHYHAYSSHAARDAMYNALRAALTAEKKPRQPGDYDMQRAIRMVESITRSGRAWTSATLIEALEPIMRPGGQGDAV